MPRIVHTVVNTFSVFVEGMNRLVRITKELSFYSVGDGGGSLSQERNVGKCAF